LEIVGTEDLERALKQAAALAAGSTAGLFGPHSMTWQVSRESAVFLAAGRALLLQLAHPWVAAAIEEHSKTLADPIGRFHRTFATVHSMLFGSLDECLAAARRQHQRHMVITGTLREAAGAFGKGSFYCANEVEALRWVHATLIESALIAYALVLPPLSEQARDRYYAESSLFAALFGIPASSLPPDWPAFSAYIDAMLASDMLFVTTSARGIAHRLLAGTTWLPIPATYRALTAELLPPRLRDAYDLDYRERHRRRVRTLLARLSRIYPLLPNRLRTVGPYQEAEQRLRGRARPDIFTQLSNCLWIGRRTLAA
jgi:uncharacterized protein (DUF2236 family)